MAIYDADREAWKSDGETITAIAARFGVSRGWIYKWVYPALASASANPKSFSVGADDSGEA